MAHRWSVLFDSRSLATTLASVASIAAVACGSNAPEGRTTGQSEFASVAPGSSPGSRGGLATAGGAEDAAPSAAAGAGKGPTGTSSTTPRTVEETDLYRLEGDRLYYLNAYRGLMVFDVSNVDAPVLLGRSPIYGSPVEMIVRNGIASVVVADWYGTNDVGAPFYGSIVRGIDATDPAHMKILGDARLGGWVRDTRVVGDVLYAVTEDYGMSFGGRGYGVAEGVSGSSGQAGVSVTSVNIADGKVATKGNYRLPGDGGVFNVTPNSILLAHSTSDSQTPQTELVYIDISDPDGAIKIRGSLSFAGQLQYYGADNGRWNLDFADAKTAHVLACGQGYCGGNQALLLATADFSKPDAPVMSSLASIPATGWGATARFDSGRMYLTPGSDYNYSGQANSGLPLQIWDLADPMQPVLAGATQLSGEVWNLIPAGDRLFALGNEYVPGQQYYTGSQVSLRYIDVSDPANPVQLGTSKFGDGWAWTPAAGTFKAFTVDKTKGLVVLPFSGWDSNSYHYNNGLQLIEYTDSAIATAGAAHSKGWTERGIFVKTRLISLSDLALSVVDYSDHANPQVVTELTLARNVVNVHPLGDSVAELSSDWWGNDVDHSTLRVLPVAEVEENVSGAASSELDIAGDNAQTFHNGTLAYIVSNVCAEGKASNTPKAQQCTSWTQEIQVVDYGDGTIKKRGVIDLPAQPNGYNYYGGWYGYYWNDWYNGNDVVQLGDDALAFRRWIPNYDGSGNYVASQQSLYMLDLSDPDAPSLASTVITTDANAWWGNMRAIGDQLFASHYEWERMPVYTGDSNTYDPGSLHYYLDRIDYSDRSKPRVGQKINVPGLLVGASDTDPSLIYTLDYRWDGTSGLNEFDVLKLDGDRAYLQSQVSLPGWVGNTFVRGNKAYMSSEAYDAGYDYSKVSLVEIDLRDARHPVLLASPPTQGWGWLVGVEGDRALVSSGWYDQGIDVYRLSDNGAPKYDQFIRTRGWGVSSLARQGDQLFVSSGYWGTQLVDLKH
ncbi:MAG: beta-propeller domain-containing protein [Pseudomonadota bacterium]